MSYPDLELKVEKLRSDYWKIKERLNKLENGRDDKVMPEGVDFSHTNPGKGYETATAKIDPLASQKEVALDWYIRQFERVSKEKEDLKIELADKQKLLEDQQDRYHTVCEDYDKVRFAIIDKQKVLEMVMDQRDRYGKENYDLNKSNQMLRGTIKNHEDKILELEKEVKYHKAFAGSEKIKMLELNIKYLEDRNRFLSDLNDEYRKMVVNDEDA